MAPKPIANVKKAREVLDGLGSGSAAWIRLKTNPQTYDVASTTMATLGASRPDLFEPLVAAVANGMRWISQQDLPALLHAGRLCPLQLLTELCAYLCDGLQLLKRPGMPRTPAERKAGKVAALAAQTGLLQAFTPLFSSLTAAMNDIARTSSIAVTERGSSSYNDVITKLMAAPVAVTLTATLATLFCQLTTAVDSSRLLCSPALAPSVPALAGTLCAVLRSRAGSSFLQQAIAMDLVRSMMTIVVPFVTLLCSSLLLGSSLSSTSAQQRGSDNASSSSSSSPVEQPLQAAVAGSSDVRDLLMAALALTAWVLHHQQHGLSAAAATVATASQPQQQPQQQQQMAIPPHHLQLLSALGMLEGLSQPCLENVELRDVLNGSFLKLLLLSFSSSGSSSSTSSNPSSSGGSGGSGGSRSARTRRGRDQVVAVVPLQTVLAECIALQPSSTQTGVAVMLRIAEQLPHNMLPPTPLASELLPAVLKLVLPAVRTPDAQAAGTNFEPRAVWSGLASYVMQLTWILGAEKRAARVISQLWLDQPQQYSAMLELHLRDRLQNGLDSTSEVAVVSGLLYRAAFSGQHNSAAAIEQLAAVLNEPQVYVLLITCFKAAAAWTASSAAAVTQDDQSAVPCSVMASVEILAEIVTGYSSLAAPSTPWEVPAAPWVALLSRCLVAASKVTQRLQQQLLSSCSSSNPDGGWCLLACGMSDLAAACIGAARCITQQLPQLAETEDAAGLEPPAGAALQQLLEQQDLLQQMAQHVVTAAAASGGVPDAAAGSSRQAGAASSTAGDGEAAAATAPAATQATDETEGAAAAGAAIGEAAEEAAATGAAAGVATGEAAEEEAATGEAAEKAARLRLVQTSAELAQQLEACGAAVAAQLPLKQWCNYHDCSNPGKASELELVGGASCVCGGCRVAHYCSRACQVAHWRGWHKAMCRRIQQLQQQQQQACEAGN